MLHLRMLKVILLLLDNQKTYQSIYKSKCAVHLRKRFTIPAINQAIKINARLKQAIKVVKIIVKQMISTNNLNADYSGSADHNKKA